jgi:integrase/recombinase XerD
MFDKLFTCPRTIARHETAPYAASRSRFLEHASRTGMCHQRMRDMAARIYKLCVSMDLDRVDSVSVRDLETFADKWAYRKNPVDTLREPKNTRKEMLCVTKKWMRFLGKLREPDKPLCSHHDKLGDFEKYLSEERGLSSRTIATRIWFIKRFFINFGFDKYAWERLSPNHVAKALRMAGEKGWTRAGVEQFAAALKSFFSFAASRGWCVERLAAAAVGPRRYAQENLPQGPAWSDVQRLLASVESNRPMDIRDRPIFLLLAIYALRVSEVQNLKLHDLDWENSRLLIKGPKGGHARLYPITGSLGAAIIRYLREVRPSCARREVFLALNAPHRPLTQGAIYSSISDRFRNLGITARRPGPHGLRHACATQLLAQGIPLSEISSHLGHRAVQSTRAYAKVDIKGLLEVGEFDLRGLL